MEMIAAGTAGSSTSGEDMVEANIRVMCVGWAMASGSWGSYMYA